MSALDGVAAPGLDALLKVPPQDGKSGARRLCPETKVLYSPTPPRTSSKINITCGWRRRHAQEGNLIGAILTYDQVV